MRSTTTQLRTRVVGLALGPIVAASPLTAAAAPSDPAPGDSGAVPAVDPDSRDEVDETSTNAPPVDPARQRAEALYQAGATLYSAADYAGAIDNFTQALALIGTSDSFTPDARARLLFNLATAHERAYNVDPNPVHLRTAREVFSRIVDEQSSFGYSEDVVTQAGTARDRLAETIDGLDAAASPTPAPPAIARDEGPDPHTGRALMISGGVLTGVGFAASGIWIAGLAIGRSAETEAAAARLPSREPERLDAIDRGRRGNALGIAGAAVSGAFVVVGVALLATGMAKRRRARRGRLSCAPAPTRHGVSFGCEVKL